MNSRFSIGALVALSMCLCFSTLFAKDVNYFQKRFDQAEKLFEDEDFVGAGVLYRTLLFANPRHKKSEKRLKEINKTLSEQLVGVSDDLLESKPEEALEFLHVAARIDPKGKLVKARFKKRGFKLHAGSYRDAAAIAAYKKADGIRSETRRAEIGIGSEFKVIRRGVFRFYTDAEKGKHKAEAMIAAALTHYKEYCRFMEPLGLHYPDEGLDVVLFQDEADYLKVTEAEGTLGVYIYRPAAGYYYLTGTGEDFATLLHEMTHQLNDKVLQVGDMGLCFEEGIAEYFGYGRLTSGNKKIKLGQPHSEYIRWIKDILLDRSDRTLSPLQDFVRMESTDAGMFYPQSWALTHFLLTKHPHGRLILADVFAGAKLDPEVSGFGDQKSFDEIVKSYGSSLGTLEQQFEEYYKTLR